MILKKTILKKLIKINAHEGKAIAISFVENILGPKMLVIYNINTATTLLLKTIIN